MVKFKSPGQLSALVGVISGFCYDANTTIEQREDGTMVVSNRTVEVEIMTNGEIHHKGL